MDLTLSHNRPFFTICIPSYNRAQHLPPLLDSIFSQSFQDFEVLICEDKSPQRELISAIAHEYNSKFPGMIVYRENEDNLGYDANIRNLVANAKGHYCFFMGNDDLLSPNALLHVHELINRHPAVGFVLKSYAWFDQSPEHINQEVRYFAEEKFLPAGPKSVSVCYRRSGVISGYIVRRDTAQAAATPDFDGTLYYQMHLTASIVAKENAVATPKVLVLCRNGEPPEFGNSGAERGKYTPGRYTPTARLNMVGGSLSIARAASERMGIDVLEPITKDYANYFYPYIKDQLRAPLFQYLNLYASFCRMGFWRYPMFHLYFVLGRLLGEGGFDRLTRAVRKKLGRSPHIGIG